MKRGTAFAIHQVSIMSRNPAKRQKVQGVTPSASDFESFAPDGDVVFIVNRDKRVRIHSVVMKGASPVFAAMLGPNFMEGQALATANANANAETDPFEIALPEEESSICFGWICRALHSQSATMLWDPKSLELVKVWSIIDKYDMQQSMQLSIMFWSDKRLSAALTTQDLWLLALVCFQNKDSASFETITKRLLRRSEGAFFTSASKTERLVNKNMQGRFWYKLAAKLQVVRTDAQNKVARLVYNEIPSILASHTCATETADYFDYLPHLMWNDGFQVFFLDIGAPASYLDEVLSALDSWVTRHGGRHGGLCDGCAGLTDLLRRQIRNSAPKIKGLCLACFEKGDSTCSEHKD
ncbi:hypothetical protein FOPG_08889 [Fusarium oxysporum f. sp. conglutinans race 2 54008]|nr:hypothetical protein FOPG_08889 [Fusarium oxysporum f. sp. conglutinans race 2 54008]KAI8406972.1 hypothetical protein FOFC_12400 [Fusarium oxysporum]